MDDSQWQPLEIDNLNVISLAHNGMEHDSSVSRCVSFSTYKFPRTRERASTQQSWQRVKAINSRREIPPAQVRKGERIIYNSSLARFSFLSITIYARADSQHTQPENLLLNISEIVFMSLFSNVVQFY